MSFAHAWVLILLALLPLLWLIRHEPPRRRVEVAGRFLWTALPKRESTPGLKPSHHRLLWIQTALMASLIVSLAGPRVATAPDAVALVLDTSMSMAAREPDGLRLDTARQRALTALAGGRFPARVRVWAAAATPVFVGEAGSRSGVEQLLAGVSPTDGWADLEAAVTRAAQDRPRPRRIHVFSDRTTALRAPNVEWVGVGRVADNLAVTSIIATRIDGEPGRLHVLLEVHNYGAKDANTSVALSVPGRAPSRHSLDVATKRTASVGVVLDDVPQDGIVSARLETVDALAADNVRYAVVASSAPVRVAVAGRSPFVEAALASRRSVIRVASPQEAHDVLVCAGCAAEAAASDPGVLTLSLESDNSPPLPVTVLRADHPVLDGVSLDGVQVVPAAGGASARDAIVLARAGGRPVIAATDAQARRSVELRFDATDPALALEPAFPLLLANVVDWLAAPRRPATSIRAGDPFRGPTSRAGAAATGTGPDRRRLEVAVSGDSVVVASTSMAGPYELDLGGQRVIFVANPATDESDLLTPPAGEPSPPASPSESPATEADLLNLVPALLIAAVALLGVEWRVRAAMARQVQRPLPWPRVLTRAMAAVLLIAGLAALRIWTGSAPVAVAFAIDRSDSSAASFVSWLNAARNLTATLGPADQVGLTVFGDTAVVERRVQEGQLPAGAVESAVAPSGTNIERALQTARASLPAGGDRRILLFSDGRQTSGDAVREAVRAAADGVRIDVVPARPGRPSARATRMTAPPTVRQGEPFEVVVVVEGPEGAAGNLQILGAGNARSQRIAIPSSGVQRVAFSERADAAGLRTYRARFTPEVADFDFEGDGEGPGAVVAVAGTPRALYAGRQGDPLTPLLRASGFQVEEVAPDAVPVGPALAAFDVVVLDEVDPLALGQQQRAALAQYVDLGGGLLVLGSERSLPAGATGDAGFDALLPVDARPRSGERGSALALVVAFDKSGSMEERVAGTPKIEYARQAVRNVAAALPPGDALGVVAFDSAPASVAPLSASRDLAGLETALRAVQPTGATAIGPALSRAAEWLNAPAAGSFDKKHVLLISDGQTSADDMAAARRAIASGRFVLSVVAVGSGADRAALDTLAQSSGGRAYFADDVRDLPNAVAREASRVSGGRTVVADFEGRLGTHPLARGLDGAPRLGGYVVTAARRGSDIVLRSHLDDPVLAIGRRGLGRVAVYTADLHSTWSAGLVRWPGFLPLVARTVRWTARSADHPLLHASVRATAAGIAIDIEAGDSTGVLAIPLDVHGSLRSPAGSESDLTFTATAPGRYAATAPAGPAGAYGVSVTASSLDGSIQGTLVRGLYYSAPQELDRGEPDLVLLRSVAEATGGRVLPPDAASLDGRQPGYLDGRPWFIGAALLLLLGDLVLAGVVRRVSRALRRFGRQPQEQPA